MNNIIWKDIPGYEGLYKANNLGQIKSLPRKTTKGGILTQYLDKSPRHKEYKRPMIRLSKNGKTKLCRVCRLVALAFIPNPDNKPEVNHIDCNPQNNMAKNLEWTTRKENHTHSATRLRMARGEKHGMRKLTQEQVKEIRLKKDSPKNLAIKMGITRGSVYRIQNNRSWVEPN